MILASTHAAAAEPSRPPTRRPASVWVTFGLLAFLSLSAIFGGTGLIFGIWGMQLIPREPLDRIPVIDTWLIPGLVLGIGFGLGSLATAYGILRTPPWPWLEFVRQLTGRHWSWLATIALGLGQLAWILIEWIYIGISPLLIIYGAVGAALTLLPLQASARRYLKTARAS
ncbi:MAG: hypothetical protein JWQ95_493 [Sphaerisporangium sp.]|jgi:hypothetical protein|nr:hypothetical protein [Sphaerisporangium sp.]